MVRESTNSESTIKFLCSYGGLIHPRQTDGKLRYVGGFTRVLAVDRSISHTELMVKLGEFRGSSVTLRCQLPNGDLDTLVSVTSDEDLANVIEEYEKASSSLLHPLKIRAILSPPKSLKTVSAPSSTTPSVDFSAQTSPYAVAGPYGHVYRKSSPPFGFPIVYQENAGSLFSYPCHLRGNPRALYHLMPQGNRWQ